MNDWKLKKLLLRLPNTSMNGVSILVSYCLAIISMSFCPPSWLIFDIYYLFFLIPLAGLVITYYCSYLPVLFILIGYFVVSLKAINVQSNWLDQPFLGNKIELIGTIINLPSNTTTLQKFTFQTDESSPIKQKNIRLSWYKNVDLKPGDRWHLLVKLRHPIGQKSEGAFDKQAWSAREGIAATGYVISATQLKNAPMSFSIKRDLFRQKIANLIHTILKDSLSKGVLIALMIGDKSAITPSQWQWFNQTGTTHLMVISGLHIGLIFALGVWLTRKFGRFLPLFNQITLFQLAIINGLLLAISYAILAGFTIPVQRAIVMLLMAMIAPLFGMNFKPSTVFFMALSAVLTIDPMAVTSMGFWYSFLAVGILLYVCIGRIEHKKKNHLWQKSQYAVFLFLLPVLLWNGQPVSLLSPFINCLAIPLIAGFIVPVSLVALLFSSFSHIIFSYILYVLDGIVYYFLQGLSWCVLPWSQPLIIQSPPHHWFHVLLLLMAIILIFSHRALGMIKLTLFFLLPWLFPKQESLQTALAKISILDVGQGLSVLIQTKNHNIIYDTGDAKPPYFSMANSVIIPYLKRQGIKHLDQVIISHSDRDHSGGLTDLTKAMTISQLWSESNDLKGNSNPISLCRQGIQWQWDKVKFEFIAGGGQWRKSNDRSCILKITANNQVFILTGDISHSVESHLVKQSVFSSADYLLLAHHGSKHSNSRAFLETIDPKIVIVSSGYMNRFGHPNKETLERVQKYSKANVYNTATMGTLTFTLGDNQPIIQSYTKKRQYYWHSDFH